MRSKHYILYTLTELEKSLMMDTLPFMALIHFILIVQDAQ